MKNVILDPLAMRHAYSAACDMMAYFNWLIDQFPTSAPYPDLFVNAFEEAQNAYDQSGDPFVTPDQAQRMLDGIEEARQWDTFNMDQMHLENNLYAISLAR